MYVRYVTLAASTYANTLADIAALLSGASVADLSATCDKAATIVIASDIAPGWTLLDAAANSGRVVSAPDADALTTKYARLWMNTAVLQINTYEFWNPVTHVGTNIGNAPGGNPGINISQTAANTIHIFANPRCFAIAEPSGGMVGCFEFSRNMDYLKGTAYPCYSVGTGKSMAGAPSAVANDVTMFLSRTKAQTAAGDATGSGTSYFSGTLRSRLAQTPGWGVPQVPLQDNNGLYYHEVRPIWALLLVSNTDSCSILGEFYNIWEATRKIGNFFDILNIGADSYMVVPNGDAANGNTILMKVA